MSEKHTLWTFLFYYFRGGGGRHGCVTITVANVSNMIILRLIVDF